MSDLQKWVEDAWSNFLAVIHGRPATAPLGADSQKLLDDVAKAEAGLAAVGPYAPQILSDIPAVAASVVAVAASKGLNIPADLALVANAHQLTGDLGKAEGAFLAAWDALKTTAKLVAAAPPKS